MRKFILGTDWWTDCDDAVALRVLARAHKAQQIELLGIVLNACMAHSIPSIEGFLNTEGVQNIPLGIDLAGTDFVGEPAYQKRLTAYAKKYPANAAAENPVALYRRLLAAAAAPVELVEIGFLQVLAALLQSAPDEISPLNGEELVRAKVARIWIMAGKWDENPGKEHNFACNARASAGAHTVCRLCPVPITFLGWEVGATVISGGELKNNDPLYGVLCDHGSPNGRFSWDPMLCLLALAGSAEKAGYTAVRGWAAVDAATGENRFVQDEKGLHAYVVKLLDDACYADAINRCIN